MAPDNPSSMLDPATWIKQAPGPIPKFTWGRPGDLPSTAGGLPNGSTSDTGQVATGTHGNSKRTGNNSAGQDSNNGRSNANEAPEEPHHPGASSSSGDMSRARQLVLLSLFDGIGTA
eukprot:71728-Heterocapsa_arctica.AAC.1